MLPTVKCLSILGLILVLVGCGQNSCSDGEERTITSGTTDLENLVYVSAPWDGTLDRFDAKDTLTFVHGLGVVPDLVTTYLSFKEEGTGNSEVTENAGNQGEIQCVDANAIRIKNSTCADFFIRVVATRLGETGEQSIEPCDDDE